MDEEIKLPTTGDPAPIEDPFFAWREKYFRCHPSIEHAREAWDAAREGNASDQLPRP